MTANDILAGIVYTSRLFPFSAAQIFDAFSKADQLALWWGPDGFTSTFEVCEFKPQGQWKFVMHGPDGKDYPNECVFGELSQQRIVIRHISAPNFTLTISFAETGNQTKLDWQQAFDDPKVAASLSHIVIPANEQNLSRLHAVLAAAHLRT